MNVVSWFEEIGRKKGDEVLPKILEFYEVYVKEGVSDKAREIGKYVLAYCDDYTGNKNPIFVSKAEENIWCLLDIDIGPIKKKISRKDAELLLQKLKEYKKESEGKNKDDIEKEDKERIKSNEKLLFPVVEEFLKYYSKEKLENYDKEILNFCERIIYLGPTKSSFLSDIKNYVLTIRYCFYNQNSVDVLSDEKAKDLLEELKKIKTV